MSERIQWIDFNGKRILYCNFEGVLDEAEASKILAEEMRQIAGASEPVLLLVNLTAARMTTENNQYIKDHFHRLNKKLKKIGLAGVSGLKTIIIEGIGRETGDAPQGMFATVDEARNWLVS